VKKYIKSNLFKICLNIIIIIFIVMCSGSGTVSELGEEIQYTTEDGVIVIAIPDVGILTVTDTDIETFSSGNGVNDIEYPILGGVTINFESSSSSENVEISIPNTEEITEPEKVVVGKVVKAPNGQVIQFVSSVKLTNDGTTLTTDSSTDKETLQGDIGVNDSGTYLFVALPAPTGFVTGKITSSGNVVKKGLIVATSGSGLVGKTDKSGNYSVNSTKESAVFYSYEPKTLSYGAEYKLVSYGTTIVNIDLLPPKTVGGAPSNGCYDEAHFMAYNKNGNLQVKTSQNSIKPTEGSGMAFITTGVGAYLNKLSKFSLTFTVEKDNKIISLDYNFMSDEYPEWVGSAYNDLFDIVAYTKSNGAQLLVHETINGSKMTPSDSGFDGEIGWHHIDIDVSAFANGKEPITLEFLVSDVADTIYDSAAVIDNLHYNDKTCKASENSAIKGGGPSDEKENQGKSK